MRHPDRPYRWGNWITVGLITGQLVGMFSSPLHVEADLRDFSVLLATVVAPGPAQALPTIEVHLGLAPERSGADPAHPSGTDARGDAEHREAALAPNGLPSSTATTSTSGDSAGTASATTGRPATGPTEPDAGDGDGGSSTTVRPTSTRPGAAPTTSTSGPTATSTATSTSGSTATTGRAGSTTTNPDELGSSAARRPCEVAADVRSSWLVTVAPGPFDRLAVLAVLAGLPDDRLVSRTDTSWLADANAGHLCLVARLPGVIDVTELKPRPASTSTSTTAGGSTTAPSSATSSSSTSAATTDTTAAGATTVPGTDTTATGGSTTTSAPPSPDTTATTSTATTATPTSDGPPGDPTSDTTSGPGQPEG